MTDPAVPPAGGVPAPPSPAPAPVPPAAAAPPPPTAAPPPTDPFADHAALNARLEQARRAAQKEILDGLGLTDPGDLAAAKAALEAQRKRADEQKTIEQRLAEAEQAQRAAATIADQRLAILKEHAARMLGVLSPEQQAAVTAIAQSDPEKQIAAITALGPTWAAAAAAARAAAPPPPATTAPPPNAPGDTPSVSPTDTRAQYAALADNPFARAVYGAAHPEVYEPKST